MNFKIITDSTADLTNEQIEKYDLDIISLSYFVDGNEYPSYVKGEKTDYKKFYDFEREKKEITTSLASYDSCLNVFKPILEQGLDVLYIVFSSGLSGTYQMAVNVAKDLEEQYPEKKIKCVDSLCASMGEGLLVHYAVMLKKEGKTLDEIVTWLEENKLKLIHRFTVDDLFFLKRGGRVSATTAIAGSLLGIKPLLDMDNDGHLRPVSKARGKNKAIDTIISQMEKEIVNPKEQIVFISHGDALKDAEYAEEQIRKRIPVKDVVIGYIGPTVGAHSGPGTISIFYFGKERD